MSGPERPIRPDSRNGARQWLMIVEDDLDVAVTAAKKLIKTLLLLTGSPANAGMIWMITQIGLATPIRTSK